MQSISLLIHNTACGVGGGDVIHILWHHLVVSWVIELYSFQVPTAMDSGAHAGSNVQAYIKDVL